MENYYQEILTEVEKLLGLEQLEKAQQLIRTELQMPYIPFDVEKQLKQWQIDLNEKLENYRKKDLDVEMIEKYLNGSQEQQLIAVEQLDEKDLRKYTDVIESYLCNHPSRYAASLLIDSCIRQEINKEMRIQKNGEFILFNPLKCLKVEESHGFLEALQLLREWFESEDPSFLKMCTTLLFQSCFEYLPLNYQEENGRFLALSVVHTVLKWTGREEEWISFFQENGQNDDHYEEFSENRDN